MLVEVIKELNGEKMVFYMRADVPPWETEDCRAAKAESEMEEDHNPEEFFASIQMCPPQTTTFVRTEDMYSYKNKGWVEAQKMPDARAYYALPMFSWGEIFGMVGCDIPVRKKAYSEMTKKEKKKHDNEQWEAQQVINNEKLQQWRQAPAATTSHAMPWMAATETADPALRIVQGW